MKSIHRGCLSLLQVLMVSGGIWLCEIWIRDSLPCSMSCPFHRNQGWIFDKLEFWDEGRNCNLQYRFHIFHTSWRRFTCQNHSDHMRWKIRHVVCEKLQSLRKEILDHIDG